ncbi:hypothetical protein [Zymomonas sp.]|uniref:hypothetical protein n=1 Tax=Zymomonas sp. TaxID=2068624 RepID=UPI0025DB1709|nr:hypothetical protein [Zymomonas sp.]MCA1956099.1 hypothetical protein [Zymomonas sp.]
MKSYILIARPRLNPTGKPVVKLLIQHQETLSKGTNGLVEEAILLIRYRIIGGILSDYQKQTYEFPACYVSYYGDNGTISLTGSSPLEGAVYLDPDCIRGNRVGSFLMNQIVQWATQWPKADINPIELSAYQGHGEHKCRRNRFYEQFGIKFDYIDNTHSAGMGRPMQAGSLIPWTKLPDNLTVIGLDDYLDEQKNTLFSTQLDLMAEQKHSNLLQAELSKISNSPFCFAIKTIWKNYSHIIGGVLLHR